MEAPQPPPPPLFEPQPGAPLPPSSRGGGKAWILWLVLGVVVVVAGIGAVAVPALRKFKQTGQEQREKRLEALKPRLPLSEEEQEKVEVFGVAMAEAISEGDAETLAKMVDVEGLADRVFLPMGGGRFVSEARQGFIKGYQQKQGGLFAESLGQNVSFMSSAEREGFPAVRLRILSDEGGMNFIDVLVTLAGDGTVRAVDLFTFLFGSYTSTQARDAMLSMMGDDSENPLKAALGMTEVDRESLKAVTAMGTAWRLRRGEGVLEIYDGLSPEKQKQRAIFLLYLQALTSLDYTEEPLKGRYLKALEAAPEVLGPESATELLMIDLQVMEEDFAAVVKSLEKLEKAVGRDAYLTHMRGLMLLRVGKVDEAEQMEKEATELEPDLVDIVDLRMQIHAARKDHAALVGVLRAFKADHDAVITREQLGSGPYEEFLKSPEFAKWEAENR